MSERPVIVIPGDDPPQCQGSPHLDHLRDWGEVRLYTDRPATFEEQIARAVDADVMINSRSQVKWPREALERLPRLRMVTVCGIGTDAVDVATARERGIVVCNVPGRTAPVVAEHTLALMLAAARRVPYQTAMLREGRWVRMDGVYLHGKRLGVVGTGNIGGRVAALARGIGMEVVAWTFNPSPERERALGVKFLPLDELLATSDVVSLHVSGTERTRGFIGRREIGLMKRGAILVNVARGPVVDTAALVDALDSGHLAAAEIDVFDQEPVPPDHPLLACEQVALTPHCADITPEGIELLNEGVVDNVIAFLRGEPRNVVA